MESLLAPEAGKSSTSGENNNKLPPGGDSPFTHLQKRLRLGQDEEQENREKEEHEESINVDSDDDEEDLNVEDDVTEPEDGNRRESATCRTPRSEGSSFSPTAGGATKLDTTTTTDRSPARSSSTSEGESSTEHRGPFSSPLSGGHASEGLGIPRPAPTMTHHPVVIHPSALRATATSWSPLGGYPLTYPPMALQGTQHPTPGGLSPAEAAAAAQRWQEAFSRIVARSYDTQNLKLEV